MKQIRKWILLFPLALGAYEGYLPTDHPVKPWFTGPLFAVSGNTTAAGHLNVEPYVFATARTSFYNNEWESKSTDTLWNLQFRLPFWVGITDRIDMKFMPVWNWNERNGQTQWTLGDWFVVLNLQLHRDQLPHTSWLPSIKFSIRETFPMGKYQELDPKKFGTDSNGMGSWVTAFSLNSSKIFYFSNYRFLNLYLDFLYSVPTSVHVKGFNAYGGGIGTHGTVHPDQTFQIFFAFEYSFNRNWAIACDATALWATKITFTGFEGMVPLSDQTIDPAGVPAVNERDPAAQFTLAPALEYNWSEDIGLIAGVWLTVAGKNTPHFTSGVVAFNYYH